MYNEAVREAQSPSLFETEYVDTTRRDDTDRRATRYIVFAGDRMPPEQKRTFDGMRIGGEVLGHDFKTLVPTKGLLRRCQITPMIVGHDDLNDHSIGVGQGGDTSQYRRREHFNAEIRQMETIFYSECLPGDELAGIFTACQGVFDYGIREITVLRDVDFKDAGNRSLIDRYQHEIFPDWDDYLSGEKEFFATTEGLRNHLTERASFVDSTVKSIIGTLLESLSQYERWATRQLDGHSRLVKSPPTAEGRVYGWEPIHHQFFDTLQLNKDSFLMKKAEEAPQREADTPTRGEFLEYQRQNAQVLAQIAETNQRLAELQMGNRTPAGTKKVCAGLKADETPCKAFAQADTEFCANHQPKGE